MSLCRLMTSGTVAILESCLYVSTNLCMVIKSRLLVSTYVFSILDFLRVSMKAGSDAYSSTNCL